MPILQIDKDISLKRIEQEDAEVIFTLIENNRIYLREWLPWVDNNRTIEDTLSFIISAQEQFEQNLGFQCGMQYRGNLTGIIGFHKIDWMNRNVEIGYWIAEKFQGNGIVTKSCKKLIDIAFYDYNLKRVQIRAATKNQKSNAIIERLGLVKEGIARQAEWLYDHYVDLNVYAVLAEEWKERYGLEIISLSWM